MSRASLSPFTGLFRGWRAVPRLPHDPAVFVWGGTLPRWSGDGIDLHVGGVGLDEEAAWAAALGEAVERWMPRPLPSDLRVLASFAGWPLDEPAVRPSAWVLFHPEQYASPAFPFRPFTDETPSHWVCCRDAATGEPVWVPEAFVFLQPPRGGPAPPGWDLAPSISTGLSAGRAGIPVVLRGLQEVIERDAVVGAWWGTYPLETHPADAVFSSLPAALALRVTRPNLTWRFFRIRTPYSRHVTLATLHGPDPAPLFSVGTACRESLGASWARSILEAVQGRHHVRHLLAGTPPPGPPVDFAGHAAYYSLHPHLLHQTVLARPLPPEEPPDEAPLPGPVLVRIVTPPGLAPEWRVVRVVVPGMQPLHGHHGLPFLGGPAWGRPVPEYSAIPPHPFP
jgi:ribosomal protein S12 methylthiotransferase accessory factor